MKCGQRVRKKNYVPFAAVFGCDVVCGLMKGADLGSVVRAAISSGRRERGAGAIGIAYVDTASSIPDGILGGAISVGSDPSVGGIAFLDHF